MVLTQSHSTYCSLSSPSPQPLQSWQKGPFRTRVSLCKNYNLRISWHYFKLLLYTVQTKSILKSPKLELPLVFCSFLKIHKISQNSSNSEILNHARRGEEIYIFFHLTASVTLIPLIKFSDFQRKDKYRSGDENLTAAFWKVYNPLQ